VRVLLFLLAGYKASDFAASALRVPILPTCSTICGKQLNFMAPVAVSGWASGALAAAIRFMQAAPTGASLIDSNEFSYIAHPTPQIRTQRAFQRSSHGAGIPC